MFVALAISIALSVTLSTPATALATDSDTSVSWTGQYGDTVTLSRLAGENADETAAAISQEGFDTSKCAIIARWDDFADALGASGLAGTLDCPILLTRLDTLSQATIDELKRLGAETVYVIGGTGAISEQIDKDLDNISTVKTHKRIWGEYSWDTSLECANAITEHGGNPRSEAIVAVSYNFQDALSISSYAYHYKVPLILEDNSFGVAGRLTDKAVSFINNTEGIIWVAGGTVAVKKETVEGVFTGRDITRLCGEDGYDTSNQIATYMTDNDLLSVQTVGIASGGQKAHGVDALAGAALIGKQGGVMLLANGNSEMEEENYTTIDAGTDSQGAPSFLTKNRYEVINSYVLGGTVVAPTAFFDKVEQILRYKGSVVPREYTLDKEKLHTALQNFSNAESITTLNVVTGSEVPAGATCITTATNGVQTKGSGKIGIFHDGTTLYIAPMNETATSPAKNSVVVYAPVDSSCLLAGDSDSTGLTSLTSMSLSNLDTSKTTNMSALFVDCNQLVTLNLGNNFDTSRVTDMSYMFNANTALESITFGDTFATSNVTNMSAMFCDCNELLFLDLGSNFDTSRVTDMSNMFYGCARLTTLDLGDKFDTSNVENMNSMFAWLSDLATLNFGNKFNTANVTDMCDMFNACPSISSLDLSSWDTANVEDMSGMFEWCTNLTSLDISNWDTSSVTDMGLMFSECKNLTSLDVSSFDTSKVTSMDQMFSNCSSLTTIYSDKDFDTSSLRSTAALELFSGCSVLVGGAGTACATAKVTDASYAVLDQGPSSTKPGYFTGKTYTLDRQKTCDIADIYSGKLEQVKFVAGNASEIVGLTSLTTDGIQDDTLNSGKIGVFLSEDSKTLYIAPMKKDGTPVNNDQVIYAPKNCTELMASLDCSDTIDFANLDTSNATNMNCMFVETDARTIHFGEHFTTSNVTDMSQMFSYCKYLTSLDLTSFSTSSTTSMAGMFNGCNNLASVTLGGNFFFAGVESYLPTPSSTYITGADGNWYDSSNFAGYTPTELAAFHNALTETRTYVAIPSSYTIVYHGNGGTINGNGSTTSYTQFCNSKSGGILAANQFKQEGKTFEFWTVGTETSGEITAANASTTNTYLDQYSFTSAFENASKGATIHLYAYWIDDSVGAYWINTAGATDPGTGVTYGESTIASNKTNESFWSNLAGGMSEGSQQYTDGSHLYTLWNEDAVHVFANRFVEFRIIQVGEHDGDGSAVTFMATHILPTAQQMNASDTSDGSWDKSSMRKTVMSSYVKEGMRDIASAALTLEKITTSGSCGNWIKNSTTEDTFWLLSNSEVFGTGDNNNFIPTYFFEEGSQYAWFKTQNVHAQVVPVTKNDSIATICPTRSGSFPENYSARWWWLRSPYVFDSVSSNKTFGYVGIYGYLDDYAANCYAGVAPAFAM